MKRIWGWILILLLAGLCMCAQAEEEHEHIYEAITDEEYRVYCTICGEAGFAPHEHVYGEWTETTVARGKDTLKKHMVRCEICDHMVIEDHTYKLRPLMVWMNGEYVSAGVHVKKCSKCNNGESIINDIYQKCVDADKEYEVLSDGTRVYVCKGCNGQFGAFSDVVEQDKHKSLWYGHAVSEFQGEYVRESLHGIYCGECNSIQIGYCMDHSESPQQIDENVHGYQCVYCFEYFDFRKHNGEYQINGAENHFIVCDSCDFEYLREAHEYDWYANPDDPDGKTHKGSCVACGFKLGAFLHEDADENRLCDICRWEMPFCMICGQRKYGEISVLMEVDGKTMHAYVCEHGEVDRMHELVSVYEAEFDEEGMSDAHFAVCGNHCNVLIPEKTAPHTVFVYDSAGSGELICADCGVYQSSTKHVFSGEYVDLGNGMHEAECTACGEKIRMAHSGKETNKIVGDSSYHETTVKCAYCGAVHTELRAHYKPRCDWKRCFGCGQPDCEIAVENSGHWYYIAENESGESVYLCEYCGMQYE